MKNATALSILLLVIATNSANLPYRYLHLQVGNQGTTVLEFLNLMLNDIKEAHATVEKIEKNVITAQQTDNNKNADLNADHNAQEQSKEDQEKAARQLENYLNGSLQKDLDLVAAKTQNALRLRNDFTANLNNEDETLKEIRSAKFHLNELRTHEGKKVDSILNFEANDIFNLIKHAFDNKEKNGKLIEDLLAIKMILNNVVKENKNPIEYALNFSAQNYPFTANQEKTQESATQHYNNILNQQSQNMLDLNLNPEHYKPYCSAPTSELGSYEKLEDFINYVKNKYVNIYKQCRAPQEQVPSNNNAYGNNIKKLEILISQQGYNAEDKIPECTFIGEKLEYCRKHVNSVHDKYKAYKDYENYYVILEFAAKVAHYESIYNQLLLKKTALKEIKIEKDYLNAAFTAAETKLANSKADLASVLPIIDNIAQIAATKIRRGELSKKITDNDKLIVGEFEESQKKYKAYLLAKNNANNDIKGIKNNAQKKNPINTNPQDTPERKGYESYLKDDEIQRIKDILTNLANDVPAPVRDLTEEIRLEKHKSVLNRCAYIFADEVDYNGKVNTSRAIITGKSHTAFNDYNTYLQEMKITRSKAPLSAGTHDSYFKIDLGAIENAGMREIYGNGIMEIYRCTIILIKGGSTIVMLEIGFKANFARDPYPVTNIANQNEDKIAELKRQEAALTTEQKKFHDSSINAKNLPGDWSLRFVKGAIRDADAQSNVPKELADLIKLRENPNLNEDELDVLNARINAKQRELVDLKTIADKIAKEAPYKPDKINDEMNDEMNEDKKLAKNKIYKGKKHVEKNELKQHESTLPQGHKGFKKLLVV